LLHRYNKHRTKKPSAQQRGVGGCSLDCPTPDNCQLLVEIGENKHTLLPQIIASVHRCNTKSVNLGPSDKKKVMLEVLNCRKNFWIPPNFFLRLAQHWCTPPQQMAWHASLIS